MKRKVEPLQVAMYCAIAFLMAAVLYRFRDTPQHLAIGGTMFLLALAILVVAFKGAAKDGVTVAKFVNQPAFRWVFMPLCILFLLTAFVLWERKEAKKELEKHFPANITSGW